jgi:hypothetical protein
LNAESASLETETTPVGWREWLALPPLGIPAIKAKVDTGARTSALHRFSVEAERCGGVQRVRFGIHPLRRRPDIEIYCEADVVDFRTVADSGRHRDKRYIIVTEITLLGESWPIEISLANRESMLFRMLLGRTAMEKRLIVDPARSYTTGRGLSRAYSKADKNKEASQ